jgi:hypothetical protein
MPQPSGSTRSATEGAGARLPLEVRLHFVVGQDVQAVIRKRGAQHVTEKTLRKNVELKGDNST